MAKIVRPSGPQPCPYMFIGEAPSREEANKGLGFVGMAGRELWHWSPIPREDVRVANRVWEQLPGNRDPKPVELARWLEPLEEDVAATQPQLIVTLGKFSTKWALGEDANLQVVHGRPVEHTSWTWRRDLPSSHAITVFPVYHPAAGIHEPRMYTFFWRDMLALKDYLEGTLSWAPCTTPVSYVFQDAHQEVSGTPYDAVDTEGTLEDPISIQVSQRPFSSVLMAPDGLWSPRWPLVFHNAVHDLKFLGALGWDIQDPDKFEDTMLLARACGDLWAGLKPLAYHLLGTKLRAYDDVVWPHMDAKARAWLEDLYGRYTPVHKVSPKTGKALKALEPAPAWVQAAKRCLKSDHPYTLWAGQKPAVHLEVETLGLEPLPPVSLREVPREEFRTYAGADPDVTGRLFSVLWKRHLELGLDRVYQIDKRAVPMIRRMEERGMRVNPDHFEALSRDLDYIIDTTMEEIHAIPEVPEDYTPTSTQKTSQLLYYTLGLGSGRIKRTKSGLPTTDDSILQALRHQHPVVPLILGVRECAKLKSAYVDKIPRLLDEHNRYHPDFGYTVSGRLTEALLLLIPKHSGIKVCTCGYIALTEHISECPTCGATNLPGMGKRIRQGFIPSDGKVFGSWDLSQIELRVLASDSQDPDLLASYRDGIDLHALTAHRVLGAPARKEDQHPALHRLPAKTTNFSIAMGITGDGLCREIKAALASAGASQDMMDAWTTDRCAEMLQDWYTEAYPVAGRHLKAQVAYARERGYVKDFLGRRRWLPGVWSPNEKTRAEAERAAQSYGMQAGAQEVAKMWQWAIWQELVRRGTAEPVIMIHDDNTLEFDPDDWEEVNDGLQDTLPQILKNVPVEAEGSMGASWGDL